MKSIHLRKKNMVAMVSDRDFERVNQYNWHAWKRRGIWYACRTVRSGKWRGIAYMHRFIIGEDNHKIHVDHRDGNGLNNTRKNIRRCANSRLNQANMKRPIHNTTGFKGVSIDRARGCFVAFIYFRGRHIFLGSGSDKTALARIYDAAAKKYFGRFARTNKSMGYLP